jgi:hypothetical protein
VVKLANGVRRRWREIMQRLPRATVLLAGVSVLPTQSGSISLLPPQQQLRAIAGSSSGLQLAPYGNFVPPSGLPDPALAFAFRSRSMGVPRTWGSDPNMAALVNFNVSVDDNEFGLDQDRADALPAIGVAAPGAIQVVCEQVPQELQAGAEFGNTQAGSGWPVQFPLRQFSPNPLSDPTQGPGGDPSNLTAPGPAGAWCRAPSLPFVDSSPLASRVFWTPVVFVLFVITVFWLSRGFRLPRH